MLRDDPIYYDKQDGDVFWFDIGSRMYAYPAWQWRRPSPKDGLLQIMDENEVAAMLWSVSQQVEPGTVIEALMRPEVNRSPFGRGYRRHYWEMNGCDRVSLTETDDPAPMVADFFDALRCSGVSAEIVDGATDPGENYPYSSAEPLCEK